MKISEIKKQKPAKVKSPVAKYMNTFNKPATFDDRKVKAKAGYEKHKKDPQYTTESAQLNEVFFLAPWVIPALATAVRIGAPHVLKFLSKKAVKSALKKSSKEITKKAVPLLKKGAEVAGKGAIKGTGKVAKGVGKAILKHPVKATILGVGAKVYTEVDELFEHIKELVGDMLDNATIQALAKVAVKWALPAAAVVAIVYGGKQLYDYASDDKCDHCNGTGKHGEKDCKKCNGTGKGIGESVNNLLGEDGNPSDFEDYTAKIKTLRSLERFMHDDPELAKEVKRRYRQLAKWKIDHDQTEDFKSQIYKGMKEIGETATAGSTSAGAIATIANPVIAKHTPKKKGKLGAPKAPQKTKADGTAVNALDMGNNLMGGATVRR